MLRKLKQRFGGKTSATSAFASAEGIVNRPRKIADIAIIFAGYG
jgi:hypothetical protein